MEQKGILSAHALDLSFDECSRWCAPAQILPIAAEQNRAEKWLRVRYLRPTRHENLDSSNTFGMKD